MNDNNNSDFDRFVTLYLAEQDKRNEEIRERDFQIRTLRIVNTLLTILLLTSLTALGWVYFSNGRGIFKESAPKDGQYIHITLEELNNTRKGNVAKAKYDYENGFYNITGNINKINDDLKYITLLNPDNMTDITRYKFNIKDDEVKAAVASYNAGDRISLNCKCVSVGRFTGFEFDIIELAEEESEYTVVPLEQLYNAYKNDLNEASHLYYNKSIITEGKVDSIDKNFAYFTLSDIYEPADGTKYKFYVPSELKQQAIILSKGQNIRVKCKCTGVSLLQGYSFVLDEIFTDPTEYEDITISKLSYEFSENFAQASKYKDLFLKFSGIYDSASNDMSYIILKNPENKFDKTIYKVYLNDSEKFKEYINNINTGKEITVMCQCRNVYRLKGYEFDLKEIDEE